MANISTTELKLDVFSTTNGKECNRLCRPTLIIKEASKQAKMYVGRSLTLHIFCFMLIDYA